jgi:hypothetical protein
MKCQSFSSSLKVSSHGWMKNGAKVFVGVFMFLNNYQRKKGNQKKRLIDSMN